MLIKGNVALAAKNSRYRNSGNVVVLKTESTGGAKVVRLNIGVF